MSAPKCLTLGDLRAATADMPDDVRVVVDGYEGGYSDLSICAPLVLLGQGHDYEGDHDSGGYDDCVRDGAVRCLCLARDVERYDEDIAHVATFRTGGPDDDLRAQVAALTAERDQARAELRTEHYRAQRELLLSLWREMEGDQEGDAPANHLLESGLVAGSLRRDEHIAELESEVQTVSDERDRLARVLACERGDEGAAPEGWRYVQYSGNDMGRWRGPGGVSIVRWGIGCASWMLQVGSAGYGFEHALIAMESPYAMLAADEAARAGEAS